MDPDTLLFKEYLGDGLYVGVSTSKEIILYTERAQSGLHWVALDSPVRTAFTQYLYDLAKKVNLEAKRAG